MTIFIPLLGYMVLFNENILNYLDLSHSIFGINSRVADVAHVSWRLVFIYYGLWFIAAGSIIYQVACPVEIKRFATSIDYISAARSNIGEISLEEIDDLVSRMLGEPNQPMRHFVKVRDYIEARKSEYADPAEKEKMLQKYWPTILEVNFRRLNEGRTTARIAVLILYAMGFGLLSVPTIDVFLRVATTVWR